MSRADELQQKFDRFYPMLLKMRNLMSEADCDFRLELPSEFQNYTDKEVELFAQAETISEPRRD